METHTERVAACNDPINVMIAKARITKHIRLMDIYAKSFCEDKRVIDSLSNRIAANTLRPNLELDGDCDGMN